MLTAVVTGKRQRRMGDLEELNHKKNCYCICSFVKILEVSSLFCRRWNLACTIYSAPPPFIV